METKILCTGFIVEGEIHWNIPAMPVPEECAPDGTLQTLVDVAHQDTFFYECDAPRSFQLSHGVTADEINDTNDYEDYLEDIEFWRTGC